MSTITVLCLCVICHGIGWFGGRLTAHWQLLVLLLALAPPALADNRPELTLEDRADVAEVNHFYDEQGRLVFDQAIWWEWSPIHERHQCLAWRLIKSPSQLPVPDHERGGFAATWNDGEVIRTVRADSYRETWLQYDPELADREVLPKERRRELLTRRDVRAGE